MLSIQQSRGLRDIREIRPESSTQRSRSAEPTGCGATPDDSCINSHRCREVLDGESGILHRKAAARLEACGLPQPGMGRGIYDSDPIEVPQRAKQPIAPGRDSQQQHHPTSCAPDHLDRGDQPDG